MGFHMPSPTNTCFSRLGFVVKEIRTAYNCHAENNGDTKAVVLQACSSDRTIQEKEN